ncbi:MAG: hypothetical protein GQ565_08130 [Candidatus Aegiribacteria sp.]|nr:hypothetical protein [Candidatus Aegiribacteria sp.]
MKNLAYLLSVLLLGVSVATAGITFYTNQTSFETLYPGLTKEDYSNTNLPASSISGAPGPFNSLTDNSCFSPGDIVDGISLDNLEGNDNVVLTPSYLGLTSVAVGPAALSNNAEYSFTVAVNAFGIDVVMPYGGSVDIEVFGAGGSLGTSTSTGSLAGDFWGVYSDVDITKIEFKSGTDGDLFSNAQFGATTALDNSTWGSIKTSF